MTTTLETAWKNFADRVLARVVADLKATYGKDTVLAHLDELSADAKNTITYSLREWTKWAAAQFEGEETFTRELGAKMHTEYLRWVDYAVGDICGTFKRMIRTIDLCEEAAMEEAIATDPALAARWN